MRKEIKDILYKFCVVRKQLILLSHFLILSISHFLILSFSQSLSAQPTVIKTRLADYFANYRTAAYNSNDPIRLTDVSVDTKQRTLQLTTNAGFAAQPFTPDVVRKIKQDVGRQLPPPYNTYRLTILANGTPIEELIPLALSDTTIDNRRWGETRHAGNAWVTPLSHPYEITHGLQGTHLSLWASHGRYYDTNKSLWKWQRPQLYCTNEDIFTQSFVVPFLMPMLENAGAIVFSPRERDWQRHEVIVDNDIDTPSGTYTETNGTQEWGYGGTGFSKQQDIYFDGENPFASGTFRRAEAQPRRRQLSQIVWQPTLPADGRYAVYVSYATLPTSVSDAEYTVRHRGVATKFRVNQQMGGGTWVYLGTFDFAAGNTADNCVTLTNFSNYRGAVTADAVRFGGGMGNIARGDSLRSPVRSGLPRYLEASRYYAQWAGMPYAIYKNKEGVADYAEDINTRSLMTNHLARGSAYLPGDSGLCVPIEMTLAIHSDAGFRTDSSQIGTLGIYTTGRYTQGEYEGLLAEGMLPSRRSRLMSRDLCDMVMTQVCEDLRSACGQWTRRQIYDRNYSETRVPEVPGIILETLSHQNFADLMRGHDPIFKMLLSRAIYKGVLKYSATVHQREGFITQPLPVRDFAACLTANGDSVLLSWSPTDDPSDYSARPRGYVVYVSEGTKGYDNGTKTYETQLRMPLHRGVLTRFVVRAFNEGGVSLPSEELCAYAARSERHRALIVNNFTRLAGPQPIDTDSTRGFDFNIDPGVVYQRSASYCGRQLNFSKSGFGGSDANELGYSGNELSGMLIAGNTFDFTTRHAEDFLLSDTTLSIASASHSALEKGKVTGGYHLIDLIVGAQRNDGYSLRTRPTFAPELYSCLQAFAQGGGALLVSGAYLSEEIDPAFAASTLHFIPDGTHSLANGSQFRGLNTEFSIANEPNEECYSMRRISAIAPSVDAFSLVVGVTQPSSVAVAHSGVRQRTLVFGFPLECIREPQTRRAVMGASLSFLLNK